MQHTADARRRWRQNAKLKFHSSVRFQPVSTQQLNRYKHDGAELAWRAERQHFGSTHTLSDLNQEV